MYNGYGVLTVGSNNGLSSPKLQIQFPLQGKPVINHLYRKELTPAKLVIRRLHRRPYSPVTATDSLIGQDHQAAPTFDLAINKRLKTESIKNLYWNSPK